MIAEDAVGKLVLVMEPHPAPYTLGWLDENVNVRITHRVLVPFVIGEFYRNVTYCNVAPMDISHLLMGRPWEFDRKIMHDGRWSQEHLQLLQGKSSHRLASIERGLITCPSIPVATGVAITDTDK